MGFSIKVTFFLFCPFHCNFKQLEEDGLPLIQALNIMEKLMSHKLLHVLLTAGFPSINEKIMHTLWKIIYHFTETFNLYDKIRQVLYQAHFSLLL